MDRPLADLAGERLVRKAPNQILALEAGDQTYIRDSLAAIEAAYGVAALPDIPIQLMPGRTLMRLLVDLRATLRPANDEQREAWGRLAGAILILDTACAFANEHLLAQQRRRQAEELDPD
ncbi:hypothetical protein A6A04_00350 [Paramagnetospirillum marisnigri]|uniref:Uncharacterized protein n=1 Tax=Paramagnetospirillum marisnigri TaxID=1285242 RepID=A0A178MRH5_9PROT|nr:hypothetical protein [Paramagnetospirillum marisnigri]OAN52191.1 hypothetical protein A6A04_00350 [Paramagnetospirillum marisnigri]